jgi:glycosyltransferase involved in cell wall biosynthesis
MLCGAPVLAGNNSSQAEVVADAGLLANSHDPADIAEKLAGLLADPSLADRLREAGRERAAGFTWEKAASRAIDAISRLDRPGRRLRVDRSPAPRARVAMFSPYPPKRSGIATYSARLAAHLARHAAVDVYHDSGYVPDLGPGTRGTARYDHRLFARNEEILGHQAVVYQFGNSLYHEFMVDCLKTRPGIVVLHDFCLAGLFAGMAARSRRPEILRDEIAHCHPDIAREVLPKLDEWALEPGFVQGACARRGIWVNRRVLELAESVIVHSPWCVEQAKAVDPSLARKMTVIPLGASAVPTTPERRERARRQFGLPDEALVIGSLGILHSTKRNVPTIEAFARVADRIPGAILVFVGEDLGFGEAAERATALGLGDRVRFFGRYPGDLADVAAMLDIGVNLREPPTNGETSAALLDLLRTGVATVVSEVGTFAHFPDHVVRKIRDFEGGPDAIADALMALAVDRDARETLGTAALDYVVREHSWERVASLYSEVIAPRARPSVPRPHLGRRRDGSAQGAQSQVIGG